jgi:hypothetical protein
LDNKKQKTIDDLNKQLETEALKELRQAPFKSGQIDMKYFQNGKDPYQKLLTMISSIIQDTGEQRLQSEQTAKSSINQAINALNDANALEQIFKACQQMQQDTAQGAIAIQDNISELRQLINQLQLKAHKQLAQFDNQTILSLQQAITSMAQAQASILQSQAASKIFQNAAQFEDLMEQLNKTPESNALH